jgi:proteasome lid subunit RPN8/RPN11
VPLTKAQAIAEFYDVLLPDPDPASLDIAQDLCEEYGLKLAALGHAMAVNAVENKRARRTRHWAEDLPTGSSGQFILSKTRDPWLVEMRPPNRHELGWWVELGSPKTVLAEILRESEEMGWKADRNMSSTPDENNMIPVTLVPNPDYITVGWAVWKSSGVKYRFEIWATYKGADWDEVLGVGINHGPKGPYLTDLNRRGETDTWRQLAEMPAITTQNTGSTLKIAEARAIDLVWRVCRQLKEHAQAGSDPVDVIVSLRESFNQPSPPRKIVNPPRVFRPQKVVALLQKDPRPSFKRGSFVGQPEDVMFAISDYLGSRAHETFLVLFINIRNQIVGYTETTSASVASVEIDGAGLMREALSSGAAAIITIHNHPTGDPDPSDEDRMLWERLRAIGKLVGVPVLDNMVVGEDKFFSESSEGFGAIPREAKEGGG